jgi:hypothetical protein
MLRGVAILSEKDMFFKPARVDLCLANKGRDQGEPTAERKLDCGNRPTPDTPDDR